MSVKDFGKRLRDARMEKGLSQRSLGLSLGLSDKTISSYESSRSYPNLDILKKLAEVLDKPFGYFLSSDYDDRIEQLQKEIEMLRSIISKGE